MYSLQAILTVAVFCTTAPLFCQSSANSRGVNSPSTKDSSQNVHYFLYQHSEYPRDCLEIKHRCSTTNATGIYVIKPDGIQEPFEVFCNHDVDTGGWTVIQRRENGHVSFDRNWTEYQTGFGFLSTDFWLGNEKLSYLTNQADYELRIDLHLSTGDEMYTTYKGFRVSDEFGEYKLVWIGAFESNAVYTDCPPNMRYGKCDCQTTCEDPKGETDCHRTCSGDEGCVCNEDFLLQGGNCVNRTECGCSLIEADMVLSNGGTYVNDDCTRSCVCNNNQLSCDDITCHVYATCVTSNGVKGCSCNVGYDGDGYTCDPLYADCKDIYDAGNTQDGVYTIIPSGWTDGPFRVYCKMDNGGGWTVFQKRGDGNTNFYRSWDEYKHGFGDLGNFTGDFWLGNDKLFYLTNQKNYKLRFDVTTSSGSRKHGIYSDLLIQSENTNYTIRLGHHSGNTGHHLYHSNGKSFSTHDRDNDQCANVHCAEKHRSGWWYFGSSCSSCHGDICRHFHKSGGCYTLCSSDNLNGDYNGGNGENIFSVFSVYGYWYSYCNLRSVEMKIKPSS